jgi:hypothetical protein
VHLTVALSGCVIRHTIALSRYAVPGADQAILLQQLKMSLPVQSPPPAPRGADHGHRTH